MLTMTTEIEGTNQAQEAQRVMPEAKRFAGDPILITGGTGGMGAAMARRFASSGARVAIVDLAPDAVTRVAADLRQEGHEIIGVAADTTDEDSMQAAVAATVQSFGSLRGLVTAAGVRQTAASFDQLSLATWQNIFDVNVTGTFVAIRAAAAALIESRGSIVTVSSVTALGARMNQSAYATSKAAVLNLTRQIALELSSKGVRVNCLCPGVTSTPMIEQAIRTDGPNLLVEKLQGSLEQFRPGIPLGRLAEAEEQAIAAEFLLSSDSSFITGAGLPVDGGVSMLG
ncbi:short-chain dehydrogenase/reductase SDR [Mycolicibacterium tokaiense]|uniref:Short-chain dehydrogenase/reductase SDR n=2 Tax=Mycolicibacterium tokaiense TaxID=39695 RepID=A0A378TEE9_9MYCO|nr:3-oxoacyl-ACP reductase [Mycolicibacterium tokaiense]STZ59168.1 short-chain dehydrogenase/reductase SDR [Mycolicibacterium tokaiense]